MWTIQKSEFDFVTEEDLASRNMLVEIFSRNMLVEIFHLFSKSKSVNSGLEKI